ncbi:GDP-L-galactose phosphorylase 1-like [Tasmannia lanceolata]|uniref:GDP-L-galactose phosphorylase 1-like n=1 Tax=Tasmannia lanceolata TaxID=3420 RepID=UPI00406325CB
MVSVEQFEDDYCFVKQNIGSELSKCPCKPLRGIKIPLYRFSCGSAKCNGAYGGLSCTAKGQSLLDSLLLAQWEDRAWNGLLRYDVTTSETKVINGRRKFVAQLNEKWNSNDFTEIEGSKVFQPLDPFEFNCTKTIKEKLLFCISNEERVNSELIPSATVPNYASLVIINANPIEYGHVFLVPFTFYHQPQFLHARLLEMVTQVAIEIDNCSFRAFCDSPADSSVNHVYFQACYFANPLPVELVPVMPILGDWQGRGIHIFELADYPIKAVLFKGREKLKVLAEVVSEICSSLREQNTPFNLLISDCGANMFLFPQVCSSAASINLSAWECGGHFIFKSKCDFDQATEEGVMKRLAAVSLRDEGFQAVKQLCCSIAKKVVS